MSIEPSAAAGEEPVVDDLMQRMRAEYARILEEDSDSKLKGAALRQDEIESIAWDRIQEGFQNRELADAIRLMLCLYVKDGTGLWALLDEARHRLELTPWTARPKRKSKNNKSINRRAR